MTPERVAEILRAARLGSRVDATITGSDPILASPFPIGEAASVAIALAGRAAADLHEQRTGVSQAVAVDVRAAAASLLSFAFQQVDGAPTPRTNANNDTVALYPCTDGWIHLHGGFPHLAAGTLRVIGAGSGDREAIAAAVAGWGAQDLEDALAAAGLCGARVRTPQEWAGHAQGEALANLPVVEVERIGDAPAAPWIGSATGATTRSEHGAAPAGGVGGVAPARPLEGVRVIDATRVLAGPTCGRTLAEHGAEVLRVSSPTLPSIAPFVIDTGHGKRAAFADLDDAGGRRSFEELVERADVLSCGYRAGSFERRGLGPHDLAERRPGIVYVSTNAYGHVGPWRERPGWEQLAQATSGIAVVQGSADHPQLLPAAATDYTTGYLGAYGVMIALARRAVEGGSWHVKVSLTQTAMWLLRLGATLDPSAATGVGDPSDLLTESVTPFGRVTHLKPVVSMSATPAHWALPTVPLGTHPLAWQG